MPRRPAIEAMLTIDPWRRSSMPPAEGLAEQERPGQVDLQHAPPLLGRGGLGRGDEADPRVVDQDVDLAEAAQDPVGGHPHRGLVGHVDLDGEDGDALGPHRFLRRGRGADVEQGQRVPLAGQVLCDHPAESLAGAGHDRHPATPRRFWFHRDLHRSSTAVSPAGLPATRPPAGPRLRPRASCAPRTYRRPGRRTARCRVADNGGSTAAGRLVGPPHRQWRGRP